MILAVGPEVGQGFYLYSLAYEMNGREDIVVRDLTKLKLRRTMVVASSVVMKTQWSLAIVAALAIGLTACGAKGSQTPPAVTKTLTVKAHKTVFSGVLSGGQRVSGWIYPSIPDYSGQLGPERVSMTIHGGSGPIAAGKVSLTSTMTDMKMIPSHGVLTPARGQFQGRLEIPMFGSYRLRIVFTSAGKRYQGDALIAIPVP